jgi:hypothetical protein
MMNVHSVEKSELFFFSFLWEKREIEGDDEMLMTYKVCREIV